MQKQPKVEEEEGKGRIIRAKDLDFGDFKETRIVKIRGHDITVLIDLPYPIQADIADIWIKYMTGIIDPRAKDRQMRDAYDIVLLHVVQTPKLDRKFLKSNKCPPEFATLAMGYIMDVWKELNSNDDVKEAEDEVPIELDDVEVPDLD